LGGGKPLRTGDRGQAGKEVQSGKSRESNAKANIRIENTENVASGTKTKKPRGGNWLGKSSAWEGGRGERKPCTKKITESPRGSKPDPKVRRTEKTKQKGM